MDDWQSFVTDVTFFLRPGERVVLGDGGPWRRRPVARLPLLGRLLAAATVTPVEVDGRRYELLAWGPADRRRGWLCLPPVEHPDPSLHPTHQELLSVCGGIVEHFGEPESWWNNQNEVWTESATRVELAPTFQAYAWIWRDGGLTIPIEPNDYYAVAVEANANLTLVHRQTGDLLLFAPDHDYCGVTPLDGCPSDSLMTIDDTPDLATWLEACATAWLS